MDRARKMFGVSSFACSSFFHVQKLPRVSHKSSILPAFHGKCFEYPAVVEPKTDATGTSYFWSDDEADRVRRHEHVKIGEKMKQGRRYPQMESQWVLAATALRAVANMPGKDEKEKFRMPGEIAGRNSLWTGNRFKMATSECREKLPGEIPCGLGTVLKWSLQNIAGRNSLWTGNRFKMDVSF